MAHRPFDPTRLPALAAASAAVSVLAIGMFSPTDPAVAAAADTAAHHEHMAMAAMPAPPPGEWVPVDEPVAGIPPLENPPFAVHREFQANCTVSHTAPDDPIVYPGRPGGSHDHTFMGNTTTDAFSTLASLERGGTSCRVPGDLSAYWMPTMYNGTEEVRPIGHQVIYYKSGIRDHTTVRPFPTGLRYVVGSPTQSAEEFLDATVQGWECGDDYDNAHVPAHCPDGTQLNVRFQAPSCWDGRHLDSPDHQSHMAYPVVENGSDVCPDSHPVAVPMVEFKMAFPVDGDMSGVHLSSGEGYSFHYDFFNAWDEATLAAMVEHCINGGLQCDARGYDQHHPGEGAALNEDYELP
ncbi:DUF1996 domain-containing protein [Allonocardiopsis opalescens]|uniref:Uncharacterized protein DUF1996 n=1 Tax=Allonocardiopsis opalescens TaxID=1144618 RepID=A0A2T0PYX4_9ACTN|nr:DUF1996 domain-containing protein [Allonocardiopsis opalescens]PRX96743.1 uncharacterized protein DUF1996 [Allonocardiopsis opalescens]